MNAQHSCATGEWYTPPDEVGMIHRVLGGIDLDPCSCAVANQIVQATQIYTAADSPLLLPWHNTFHTAFVNPPGCCDRGFLLYSGCSNLKKCSCRLPRKFLEKSITEAAAGMNIIYLAYSVNQIRQLSNIDTSAISVSIAIPPDRIPYIDPLTMLPKRGTNCDSAFVCLSSNPLVHSGFRDIFGSAGSAVYLRS